MIQRAAATSMSVGKNPSPSRRQEEAGKEEAAVQRGGNGGVVRKENSAAAGGRRYGRCFSGLELNIGPGPLKDVDASKLKGQIRKWARAVVAVARQLSFGSPRSSASRRMSGGDATAARSETFPSKSGLAGAGDDPG